MTRLETPFLLCINTRVENFQPSRELLPAGGRGGGAEEHHIFHKTHFYILFHLFFFEENFYGKGWIAIYLARRQLRIQRWAGGAQRPVMRVSDLQLVILILPAYLSSCVVDT